MAVSVPQHVDNLESADDFASHLRQYDRFIHLVKWFSIHMFLLLVGLYFLIIGGQAVTGTLFIVIALVALGYGIVSTARVARDISAAIGHRPDPT